MNAFHIGLLASALTLGVAQAQTTTTAPAGSPPAAPGTIAPGAVPPSTNTPAGRMATPTPATPGTPGSNIVNRNTGPAAASGDTNQAVATTTANAPTPARGRNSFTMGEARRRIEGRGYSQVAGLTKDANGVWRGRGMKDGSQVNVWLDYKGNVGQN